MAKKVAALATGVLLLLPVLTLWARSYGVPGPWRVGGYEVGVGPGELWVDDVPRGSAAATRRMSVPFLLLAAAAGMAVVAAYRVGPPRLNRQRRPAHLCRACGYDLRASPGRCPECGTEPDRKDAPAPRAGSAGGAGRSAGGG